MSSNVSHPVRFTLALLAAGVLAANLASCSSACGDRLEASLKADEPGDYVFEGFIHDPPRVTPFLCSYSVRANAEGVLRASVAGECEGRVGLDVSSSDAGDYVWAWFHGGPAKVSWTLSWTHPAALSESPNQLAGTLDPDYQGEEGCSSASETIP